MSANSSTTNDWLRSSSEKLLQAGVESARLDCLILLEDALQSDRSYILAHPENILEANMLAILNAQIERRLNHEPLAYIRGVSEFFGREFIVNKHTLEPRPETENIIHILKKLVLDESISPHANIADIGTGSGCIAITSKLEHQGLRVHGTDISKQSIAIARQNAEQLQADVAFILGDLLEPLAKIQIDVLLCNLPYVPNNYEINQAAQHEPRHAIFGGVDGLDLYKKLFTQIDDRTQKPTHIITESLVFQHHSLAQMARTHGYALEKTKGLVQLFTQ